MNRLSFNVILGGFGSEGDTATVSKNNPNKQVKQAEAEDTSFSMKNASSVIIITAYGMAVVQVQHALKEIVDKLKTNSVKVSFGIHSVTGLMPGYMNVLLAEINVHYDNVFE